MLDMSVTPTLRHRAYQLAGSRKHARSHGKAPGACSGALRRSPASTHPNSNQQGSHSARSFIETKQQGRTLGRPLAGESEDPSLKARRKQSQTRRRCDRSRPTFCWNSSMVSTPPTTPCRVAARQLGCRGMPAQPAYRALRRTLASGDIRCSAGVAAVLAHAGRAGRIAEKPT